MPLAAVESSRPAAGCPPAPVRATKSLPGYGMLAGPFYVAASLIEALTRGGFTLVHDDWSLLATGAPGWIHVLVLVLTGLMVGAAAVGVVRQLRTERLNTASGWFLGVYGTGLTAACLVPACQFRSRRQLSWAVFSPVTGVLFLAAFAGIATGGAASRAGVLAFTGAVILAWAWLALVSAHLYRRAPAVAA